MRNQGRGEPVEVINRLRSGKDEVGRQQSRNCGKRLHQAVRTFISANHAVAIGNFESLVGTFGESRKQGVIDFGSV